MKNASSRLVAARGGKKGRFRSFDRDAVLSPEKELGAAVGMNCRLRDQQAPYTAPPRSCEADLSLLHRLDHLNDPVDRDIQPFAKLANDRHAHSFSMLQFLECCRGDKAQQVLMGHAAGIQQIPQRFI